MRNPNLIIRDTESTLWRTEPRYWAGNRDGSYDGTDRWTYDRNAANVYTADEVKAFPKGDSYRLESLV
jgi:hypothetical protein